MSNRQDSFRIEGGCWCPGERTLYAMRLEGHTKACTEAREGWKANHRHMTALQLARAADEAAGRQLREAAVAVLTREEVAT